MNVQERVQVKILRLFPDVKLPSYQTAHSAGMDLHSYHPNRDLHLEVGKTLLVPTGLKIEIPHGFFVEIRPRSGFSTKNNIIFPNSIGTIDSDYRGEILIPLLNVGREKFILSNNTRIGQMLVFKSRIISWEEVQELGLTERGEGGFGSTGN